MKTESHEDTTYQYSCVLKEYSQAPQKYMRENGLVFNKAQIQQSGNRRIQAIWSINVEQSLDKKRRSFYRKEDADSSQKTWPIIG